MTKVVVLAFLQFLGMAFLALPALAQSGPQTGDDCAAWILCGDGGLATGSYPACECGKVLPPPPPLSCATDAACRAPFEASGEWPNCACVSPPVRKVKCGACTVRVGNFCVPITCAPPE